MNIFSRKKECPKHCQHDAGMYFVTPLVSSHGPYETRQAEKVNRCCHCGVYFDKDNVPLETTDNVFCLRRTV